MKRYPILICLAAVVVAALTVSFTTADPCGMVPPIYTGDSSPIARTGLQKTYVFHKDGVETFVIRPGFTGNVDNFGMLIPFPSPPSLRKVPDDIFNQVENAIDPPEVVYNFIMRRRAAEMALPSGAGGGGLAFRKDSVQVLKQEAVGMYEVAVLQAGSAAALKKWMDENGFQYPAGMDKVTEEYIEIDWCFVAVKTKVAAAQKTEPQPGQRRINPKLPKGSVFDGYVQGMGFRFETDELVVPMRLSAFNDGELRNVVYLLTDEPKKIRSIPEEYVVRQLSGQELIDNLTNPLPLRIIGGTEANIPEYARDSIKKQRRPGPKNGKAKELFTSDLIAVAKGNLALRHEELEKELLAVGEHFGLRGDKIDVVNADALKSERDRIANEGLELLKGMTLTVVDGDFPRDVIANENLKFARYEMPANKNSGRKYDAKLHGPAPDRRGTLKIGAINWKLVDRQVAAEMSIERRLEARSATFHPAYLAFLLPVLGLGYLFARRRSKWWFAGMFMIGMTCAPSPAFAQTDSIPELIANHCTAEAAKTGFPDLLAFANNNDSDRDRLVRQLIKTAKKTGDLPKQGWAIAALAQIGGQDVDEYLLNIHADEKQKKVVRTWAAAARVSMTQTLNGLIEKANLIGQFPALGRPIGMRIVEKLNDDKTATAEQVIRITMKLPQLQSTLAPMIMNFGHKDLLDIMYGSADNNLRRTATGYVGALAQNDSEQKITRAVVARLKFQKTASTLPWGDGQQALFIPGVKWEQEEARQLVGALIRWMVWAEGKNNPSARQQIHNNIRSLALARAAGYKSPGWRENDLISWLETWKQVVGKDGIRQLLAEQNLADDPRFARVLN